MKITYSHQAKIVIHNLKDFDFTDFENWMRSREIDVGNKIIMEYLIEKENKNGNIK